MLMCFVLEWRDEESHTFVTHIVMSGNIFDVVMVQLLIAREFQSYVPWIAYTQILKCKPN